MSGTAHYEGGNRSAGAGIISPPKYRVRLTFGKGIFGERLRVDLGQQKCAPQVQRAFAIFRSQLLANLPASQSIDKANGDAELGLEPGAAVRGKDRLGRDP